MDAATILDMLKKALKEFGTYSFDDKGPREVMDVDKIVADLNAKPVEEVITILNGVSKGNKKRGRVLVHSILCDMQDVPDERWQALMNDKAIHEAFADE